MATAFTCLLVIYVVLTKSEEVKRKIIMFLMKCLIIDFNFQKKKRKKLLKFNELKLLLTNSYTAKMYISKVNRV